MRRQGQWSTASTNSDLVPAGSGRLDRRQEDGRNCRAAQSVQSYPDLLHQKRVARLEVVDRRSWLAPCDSSGPNLAALEVLGSLRDYRVYTLDKQQVELSTAVGKLLLIALENTQTALERTAAMEAAESSSH